MLSFEVLLEHPASKVKAHTKIKGTNIRYNRFIVFVIPFASLKAQTSYEKCCAPPLFDL